MRYKIFMAMPVLLAITTLCMANPDNVDAHLRAFVDKKSVLIGDRIVYTIEIRSFKNLDIEAVDIKKDKIGNFEIKDSGSKRSRTLFGKHIFVKWYSVAAYSTGRDVIPSVAIRYKTKGSSEWNILKTPELPVMIGSVLPPGVPVTDIKDIKGPISFYSIGPWIIAFASFFIVAAILAGLFRKLVRRKILKPSHEIALKELETIRASFRSGGNIKEYYVGISDCVRRYIEARFDLKAPEMTTEEFLDSLKDSAALSSSHKGLMRDFMSACDLVKFAKYMPGDKEIENVYVTAKDFIGQTREGPPKTEAEK